MFRLKRRWVYNWLFLLALWALHNSNNGEAFFVLGHRCCDYGKFRRVVRQIEMNTSTIFHWGRGMCSGFMVFNVSCMDEIWKLARTTNVTNISATHGHLLDDQLVVLSVNVTYPNEVAVFEDGWDMTISEKWKFNGDLVKQFPDVGMISFQW